MKRQFHLLAVVLLMSVYPFTQALSNNLSITNLSFSLTNKTVTFDLSWNNGWRNTGVSPHNWDAAWIFVKWRDCAVDNNTTAFTHGLISTDLADHNFNVNSGATTYEPTKANGTVGIDAAPNNTGVMLRNSQDPVNGTFSATVTLTVTNFPTSGSYDVRVFGLEMVYCLQNPYFLGDGDFATPTVHISNYSFSNAVSQYKPFYVSSESAQSFFESSGQIVCPSGNCAVLAPFQKGYNAFYIMKHEISQGQYANFLSTVPYLAQLNHYPQQNGPYNSGFSYIASTSSFTNRYTINGGGPIPTQYTATRPDRACNWLSWSDLSAYLDWAALRPLSEMEFEKACRGSQVSVPFERAWGTSYTKAPIASDISGAENGTEVIITSGVQVNCPGTYTSPTVWTSGDGGSQTGPLRCGIFAKSSNTQRVQSGTGYYGATDLSGNVSEYYISAYCGVSGQTCQAGIGYGDGDLDVNGNANVTSWPNKVNPYNGTTGLSYIIKRGGDWYSGDPISNASSYLNVSTRSQGTLSTNGRTRDPYMGGRGGR